MTGYILEAPFYGHRKCFTPWPDGTVEVQNVAWIGHPYAAWLTQGIPHRLAVAEARSLWSQLRAREWTRLGS